MAEAPKKAVADPEVTKWANAISAYEREFKKWETRAEKIVKIYRDHDSQADSKGDTTSFSILWSNVQVLLPATFARLPKPDVSRRFRDNDPVGRVASLILERALDYEIDHYPDYRASMENSVLDRFLGGRGTSWVRYEPHIVAMPGQPEDGAQITEDADENVQAEAEEVDLQEEIEYECAPVDYVHYKDFGHTIARTWEEVTAVWRRVYMDRDALVKRFGEQIGNAIPLDVKPEAAKNSQAGGEVGNQACVYEIWDKSANEALWYSKSQSRILDRKPDPLGLENFFPCPRPLYATVTTDTLIPVPDYKLYQDQARQLNKLANRIDGLIDMLQVKGVYDSAVPELQRLFTEGSNGQLVPVKNWAAFAEKVGLKGSIDILDLAPIVQALNEAYAAVDKVKNQVYEIMGIADIVRGSSDPNETLGAQKMKGQFGNMRLRGMQGRVIQFATELLQIKAQIICKHFQPETIARIAAVDQLTPEDQQLAGPAMQLLLGARAADPSADTEHGPLAGFRVEVSSDSMIQMDEQQEKADRTEFLTAVGGYLDKALPILTQAPQAAPLVIGLLKFGVTGFKVGKQVEGMIDAALDQLTKQAAQPQEPKPDPEMAKVQATAEAKQQEIAAKAQADQAQIAAEERLEQSRQAFQAEEERRRNELEAQRAAYESKLEAQLEAQRQANAKELEAMRGQITTLIAQMNNAAKVEVAEIGAKTTLQAAQTSAANAASEGAQ